MSSEPFCVFKCDISSAFRKIKKFTEESLKLCHEKLRIRVAFNLKYSNVVLPDCADDIHGYHSVCRGNFLAITKFYMKKYEELQNKTLNVNIDDPTLLAAASTSLANVSGSDNIEQGTESSQLTCMSVDLEQNQIIKKQEPDVHEKASDEASSNQNKKIKRICFFCEKNRRSTNNPALTYAPLFSTGVDKLRNHIYTLSRTFKDSNFERKLDAFNVNGKILYHNQCRQFFLRKNVIGPIVKRDTERDRKKFFHELTYEDICAFVETNIINNKGFYSLKFIADCYNEILETYSFEEFKCADTKYRPVRVLRKLQKTFGGKIQVIVINHKKLIGPEEGCSFDDETLSEFHNFECLSRAALILRKKVSLVEKKSLPTTLELNDVIAGECENPKYLTSFMQNLLCGFDPRTHSNSDNTQKIDSISQDIIYAIHDGKMKTSKHMTLGMTLKCLTSDQKAIDIVNKLGHCCSYDVVEELEKRAGTCYEFSISPEDSL